jgi:hypothetical protein
MASIQQLESSSNSFSTMTQQVVSSVEFTLDTDELRDAMGDEENTILSRPETSRPYKKAKVTPASALRELVSLQKQKAEKLTPFREAIRKFVASSIYDNYNDEEKFCVKSYFADYPVRAELFLELPPNESTIFISKILQTFVQTSGYYQSSSTEENLVSSNY